MKACAAARALPRSRPLARPNCPQCGDVLFAAAVSVHVHDNDIRHWWSCESCGHQFMTVVALRDDNADSGYERV